MYEDEQTSLSRASASSSSSSSSSCSVSTSQTPASQLSPDMADFGLQLTFNSQRQAKEVLSRIAAFQGFKIEKRKPVERAVAGAAAAEANADVDEATQQPQLHPPPQVQLQPQTKAARQLEYSQVISFVCSNWYRDERCGWFIAMHRVATEPEERW